MEVATCKVYFLHNCMTVRRRQGGDAAKRQGKTLDAPPGPALAGGVSGQLSMVKRPFDLDSRLAALNQAGASQFSMAIDAAGRWHYQGSPILRPALVQLFATALQRAADGSYWLVTPFEAGRVEVADVPFTIVELECRAPGPEQTIRLRSNLDEWVDLDAGHPLAMRPPPEGGAPAPYFTLRPATGSRLALEARLLRPVFYHLVELAELAADDTELVVRSAGAVFSLGRVDPS